MFPIRDHNPSERTPIVTYVLLAVNILVFLGQLSMEQRAENLFILEYGMIPARLAAGEGYHTLITSQFLHGGFMHLAGNMLYLWIFGDNLEDELGHIPFLIFYLASGIGAALIQAAPDLSSVVPMVGASGAIAGVMGGYLLFFPKARVDVLIIFVFFFKVFPVPAWIMLGLWFGLQALNSFGGPLQGGGVAYLAHVGGFVVGLLWVTPKWLREGGTAFWQRTQGHPPHPEAKYQLSKSRVPVVKRKR